MLKGEMQPYLLAGFVFVIFVITSITLPVQRLQITEDTSSRTGKRECVRPRDTIV
jgi:hypothetical protein